MPQLALSWLWRRMGRILSRRGKWSSPASSSHLPLQVFPEVPLSVCILYPPLTLYFSVCSDKPGKSSLRTGGYVFGSWFPGISIHHGLDSMAVGLYNRSHITAAKLDYSQDWASSMPFQNPSSTSLILPVGFTP